jgi:hypothetical protein
MSFSEALFFKESYGSNAVLPEDMRNYTLDQLRAGAAEEKRPAEERRLADESARRVDGARHAIGRALLAGPPKRRTPARLRACFLRQLERLGTVSDAAAAIGIDRRTINRWRERDAAFAARCTAALAARRQLLEDELIAQARTPQVRPHFYAGKKIGESIRRDSALALRMLDRLNASEARTLATKRSDPQALASAFAASLGPVLAEQMQRVFGEAARREMPQGAGQPESQYDELY